VIALSLGNEYCRFEFLIQNFAAKHLAKDFLRVKYVLMLSNRLNSDAMRAAPTSVVFFHIEVLVLNMMLFLPAGTANTLNCTSLDSKKYFIWAKYYPSHVPFLKMQFGSI
jgi:hypothetical protein